MCGIVGVFSSEALSTDVLRAPIAKLTKLIERRGPDDEGCWDDGSRCAFGFRRLAILDLAPTGHQPMTTRDGRFALVFNGEIYNFREIRAELERRGHVFRSTGDAEVVLVALAEWGTDALRRMNGMFALGFYDAREKVLTLARDHAGIKPLWFAHTSRGVVFASQYDQVIAHPWTASHSISRPSLGLYLRLGFVPAPFGLHDRTGQLEAGEWRRISADGSMTSGRHFHLPKYRAPTLRADAALEAFEGALSAAVRRQLVADVPVGVFLSGGIDSPLVAAEAQRASPLPLRAFTICVEDAALDESETAARYAQELGVQAVRETITSNDALAMIDDATAACTEPTADFSIFPTLLVSRLARRDVKVALSGDGGDELYWGYPSRFGSAISLAPYFAWPRVARLGAVATRKFLGRGVATRDILEYSSIGRLYQRKHTLMAEADLAAVFPGLPAIPQTFDAFEFRGTDPDEVAQWVRWNEFSIHLARVLAKVDRASMYHSLEVRVPLLDREVMETAWNTDWRSCLDVAGRRGKLVLRRSLAKRVSTLSEAKKGFTIPMYDWLVGPLRPLLHDLVLSRHELLGLEINRAALRDLEGRMRGGDRSKAWGLWLLLALVLWHRRHGNVK